MNITRIINFHFKQKALTKMALVLSLIAFVSSILLMNPSSADVNDPIAFTSVSAQESPAPLSDCGVTPNELKSVSGDMQSIVIQSGGMTNGESISMPLILTSAPDGLAGYFLEVSLDNPATASIVGVDFPDFGLTRNVSNTGSAVQFAAADLMGVVQSNASNATIATLNVETMSEGSTTFHVKVFKMDDDIGDSIQPYIVTGSLVVFGKMCQDSEWF